VVVNAECGVKPGGTKSSCDSSAENSIAIIQARVDRVLVIASAESVGFKDVSPIDLSGGSFEVAGIT